MSCFTRIDNMRSELTGSENQISDYIIDNIELAKTYTSVELATASGVSQSAIVKFCQKLGYKGYSEFRIAMNEAATKRAQRRYIHDQIGIEDSPETIMLKIAQNSKNAIDSTMDVNNPDVLREAADCLSSSSKIILLGIGASALVAMDFFHKLLKIDKHVIFDLSSHVQLASIATLKPDDVVFAVSYSGESKEIIVAAEQARRKGAKLISLTRYSKNTLVEISDVNLYAIAEENTVRSSAIASRIAQLTIVDSLFIMMVLQNTEYAMQRIAESSDIVKAFKTGR